MLILVKEICEISKEIYDQILVLDMLNKSAMIDFVSKIAYNKGYYPGIYGVMNPCIYEKNNKYFVKWERRKMHNTTNNGERRQRLEKYE